MNTSRLTVFQWPEKKHVSISILMFFFLSVFLHAASFYLFQVVYPPAVALPPSPVALQMLQSESSPSAMASPWLQSEDPSLIASTLLQFQHTHTPLHSTPYKPNYSGDSLPLLPFPQPQKPPTLPLTLAPGTMGTMGTMETVVDGTGDAGGVGVGANAIRPHVAFAPGVVVPEAPVLEQDLPIPPTQILVLTSDDGRVFSAFIQNSSTSPQADQLALNWIQKASNLPKNASFILEILWLPAQN